MIAAHNGNNPTPATFIFGRSLAYQALILDDVDFGNRQHVLATG
jgi:hypothetical protein